VVGSADLKELEESTMAGTIYPRLNARFAAGALRNREIYELTREPGEGNVAWLARAAGADASPRVILLGGGSLPDFRVRSAQAEARSDLLPSFWSRAILALKTGDEGQTWRFWSAGIEGATLGSIPGTNGIHTVAGASFDDPARLPNAAALRFPGADTAGLVQAIEALRGGRLVEDVVTPIAAWLGFMIGARGATNPLLEGIPPPDALFIDAAFSYVGVDLVPGVSSRGACPEALWQSALWWSRHYGGEGESEGEAPSGAFTIGQAAASVVEA